MRLRKIEAGKKFQSLESHSDKRDNVSNLTTKGCWVLRITCPENSQLQNLAQVVLLTFLFLLILIQERLKIVG